MTVLVLNNLGKNEKQNVSQAFKNINLIAGWLVDNIQVKNSPLDFALMKLVVTYQNQLLALTKQEDHLELVKNQEFLSAQILVIFMIDSKDLKSILGNIFECLGDITEIVKSTSQLKSLNVAEHKQDIKLKYQILENLFEFWQKIILTLLHNKEVQTFCGSKAWI